MWTIAMLWGCSGEPKSALTPTLSEPTPTRDTSEPSTDDTLTGDTMIGDTVTGDTADDDTASPSTTGDTAPADTARTDTGAPCLPPTGVETGLSTAGVTIGASFSLGAFAATASIPEFTAPSITAGGALVFSDSPETVLAPALLYEDTLPAGASRVYVYHVNGSGQDLRFSVVLAGAGSPATATVAAEVRAGPSVDWDYVGKIGAERYVVARRTPPAARSVSVPASGAVVLDPALDALVANPGELQHAVYDLQLDAPAVVRIVAVTPSADATTAVLAPAARDTHDRGTFAGTERLRTTGCYDTAGGTVRLRLASGSVDDPWVTGVDALTGSYEALAGNYGVFYEVRVPLRATDGRTVAAVIAPRGGNAAGSAWVGEGMQPDAVVTWPNDADVTPPDGTTALLGRWDPAVHAEAVIRFSPAGSTSLPLDLILVPE